MKQVIFKLLHSQVKIRRIKLNIGDTTKPRYIFQLTKISSKNKKLVETTLKMKARRTLSILTSLLLHLGMSFQSVSNKGHKLSISAGDGHLLGERVNQNKFRRKWKIKTEELISVRWRHQESNNIRKWKVTIQESSD